MLDKQSIIMNKENHKKVADLPELLTLEEAYAYLKCHPNTLRSWDKKNILPAIRIGVRKVRRYKKDALEKFVQSPK